MSDDDGEGHYYGERGNYYEGGGGGNVEYEDDGYEDEPQHGQEEGEWTDDMEAKLREAMLLNEKLRAMAAAEGGRDGLSLIHI